MQRLHYKVSGNWQKFTTMLYEINKPRDLKKKTGNHIWKKGVFFNYDNDRKENTLIYAHHISYKNIRNFCRLFEPDFYTKLDKKKNVSKVPNNLLKSNCEFEGLGKFKMILLSICLKYFRIISQVPKDWKIKIKQFLIGWYSIWSLLSIGKYTFYHRNNFGTKILIVFPVCMKMSVN